MDINELENELNGNGQELTDAQIREKNKKYVDEVVQTYSAPDTVIHPPAPVSPKEMDLLEKRANERGTLKDDSKYYSPTMPNAVEIATGFEEIIDASKLDFGKKYDPNDFFIKAKLDGPGIKVIQKRIASEYDAPFQVVNSKRYYATYYPNLEAWCLELFFEAIGWDAKIVEATMHKDNSSLRSQIAAIGLPTLALAARGRSEF